MMSDLLPAALLLLGVAMGFTLSMATYMGELKRIARFLRNRNARSNARATTNAVAPGISELADAINTELDRSAQAHVEVLRRQQGFQRDLSALSHDIRTPLTGAKGYLQLAGDEMDAEQRNRHLAAATARIDSTTELLDQLFAYTKSTDPDLALAHEPVALTPLVERVLLGHYPEFEAHGWEPSLEVDDAAATVMGDSEAILRIIENLVTNAIRHGAGAPRIELRRLDRPAPPKSEMQRPHPEAASTAGSGHTSSHLELRISNPVHDPTSIDAARLFERFYQADAARGAGGSGLGLSVAANLAHAMDMDISATIEGNILAISLTAHMA